MSESHLGYLFLLANLLILAVNGILWFAIRGISRQIVQILKSKEVYVLAAEPPPPFRSRPRLVPNAFPPDRP